MLAVFIDAALLAAVVFCAFTSSTATNAVKAETIVFRLGQPDVPLPFRWNSSNLHIIIRHDENRHVCAFEDEAYTVDSGFDIGLDVWNGDFYLVVNDVAFSHHGNYYLEYVGLVVNQQVSVTVTKPLLCQQKADEAWCSVEYVGPAAPRIYVVNAEASTVCRSPFERDIPVTPKRRMVSCYLPLSVAAGQPHTGCLLTFNQTNYNDGCTFAYPPDFVGTPTKPAPTAVDASMNKTASCSCFTDVATMDDRITRKLSTWNAWSAFIAIVVSTCLSLAVPPLINYFRRHRVADIWRRLLGHCGTPADDVPLDAVNSNPDSTEKPKAKPEEADTDGPVQVVDEEETQFIQAEEGAQP